jgi:hypothetical protein
MNQYEISRNYLLSTASRTATKVKKASEDPTMWSHLFHTAMDLLSYERLDAQPCWILRAIDEGTNLSELWDQSGMENPRKPALKGITTKTSTSKK